MDRDTDRARHLTRRALLLGGAQLGMGAALVGRMYYLQVVEHDRYRMLSDQNRISVRLVAPARGLIVDRTGTVMAGNAQNFRALLTVDETNNVRHTLERVSPVLGLDDTDWRRILRDIRRSKSFVPVLIRENLTWDQVSALEVNAPDLPGVSIDVGQTRIYPFTETASHLLGYVGSVSEADLKADDDPLLSLPGFRIGKNGVEKIHDHDLRGTAGTAQYEVNSVGRVIRELAHDDGEPGRQVTLTIDMGLQSFVHQRLSQERSAAAVILDAHTGAAYALASTPGYDPNEFASGISQAAWDQLVHDQAHPLINKAISGQYPPGSTFKLAVAMGALEAGIIDRSHIVDCTGVLVLGDHKFHCWKHGGHGPITVVDAIAQSCDVFFYDTARRLGIDRVAEMANRLGLGRRLDFDLPQEHPGLIPTKEWKLGAFGTPWQQGETLICGIGQGYVLATPLQLAVMVARLVNGGFAVGPHITRAVQGKTLERTAWPSIGLHPGNVQILIEAMSAVTMNPHGTAYEERIKEPGFEMGGKTGSAQVRHFAAALRDHGEINNATLPWDQRDHAWFVAFAPLDAPRYTCAVLVEHGMAGATAAAPIAHDILMECQRRDPARNAAPIAMAAPAPVSSDVAVGAPPSGATMRRGG